MKKVNRNFNYEVYRSTIKDYDAFTIHHGYKRVFLAHESGIIDVEAMKYQLGHTPELDQFGYLKQLKKIKKKYVICLNLNRSIEMLRMNLFIGKKHKLDEVLIFLSDMNHKIIQSNNYEIMDLIHNSIILHQKLNTLCSPEKSKAMIQDKFISGKTEDFPGIGHIKNQEADLANKYMAYAVFGMKSKPYRLKDFKVMLLPFENNSFSYIGESIIPFPLIFDVPFSLKFSGLLKEFYNLKTRYLKELFLIIHQSQQSVYVYIESLFDGLSIQDINVQLKKARYLLDIPDYWDVDDGGILADYYLLDGGEDWFRHDDPDAYKFYNQYVKKIFKEYQLLSSHRKNIFKLMVNNNFPIIPSIALLRDGISPADYSKALLPSLPDKMYSNRKRPKKDKADLEKLTKQIYDILMKMDPYQSIKTLIEQDESEQLEFKSTYRYSLHKKNYDNELIHEVLKTLSGFLNTKGGKLIIGVSDNKEIIGIEKDGYKDNDKFILAIQQMMMKYLGKPNASRIKVRIEEYQNKKLCIIDCPKALEPVIIDHYAQKNRKEIYYVRSGPSTVSLGLKEYQRHVTANFSKD